MKKILSIIGLLLIVTLVNSYNYPNTYTGRKTLEIMYDSKKRPHKIVIYSEYEAGMSAIDLDANTYK